MLLYYHHLSEYYETANIDSLSIWLKKDINPACKLFYAAAFIPHFCEPYHCLQSFWLCLTFIFAPSVLCISDWIHDYTVCDYW